MPTWTPSYPCGRVLMLTWLSQSNDWCRPCDPNQTRTYEVSQLFSKFQKSTTSGRHHRKFAPLLSCWRRPPTDGTLPIGPPNVFGQNLTCQPPDISTPHSFLWENFSTTGDESAWRRTHMVENPHGREPTWRSVTNQLTTALAICDAVKTRFGEKRFLYRNRNHSSRFGVILTLNCSVEKRAFAPVSHRR